MTTVADGLYQYGGMPVTGGVPPFVSANSQTFFVDPVNGADGNSGKKPNDAFASLYRAHYMMTSGNNDVCYLIGNGATTGTARLSLANALAAQGPSETPATTGVLTWSKNACHLIGIGAATQVNQRARISSVTGDTYAGFGSTANFMVISGSGCYFSNFAVLQAIAIGLDGNIGLSITGDQNCFNNVHVGFPQGTSSIAGAATRAAVLTAAHENTFYNCAFGLDTITRSTTNSTVEFAGGCARNIFRGGLFLGHASTAGTFHLLITGTGIDRFLLFDNCSFMDGSFSGGVAQTVVMSATQASTGGVTIFQHSSMVSSLTTVKWADANGLTNAKTDNVGGAATGGLMIKPS